MAKRPLPTPAELRQLLRYEAETGKLYWRERAPEMFAEGNQTSGSNCARWNASHAGQEALIYTQQGYRVGIVCGRTHKAHRVAWALYYGEWPDGCIDHINHDSSDNRIVNLRVVSHQDNMRNRRLGCNNTSGVTGVTKGRNERRWKVQIRVGSKLIYLGRFDNIEDATLARAKAEQRYYFHPNHGKKV